MAKLFKANHAKESKKQTHCPICNRYIKYIEGYPAYVCGKCIEIATDKDGKAVVFKTITEMVRAFRVFTETPTSSTARTYVSSKE